MSSKKEIKAFCKFKADRAATLAGEYDTGDIKTSVGDMLADIMHLCHVRKWDFEGLCDQGRVHFEAEKEGGEHG